MKELSVVIASQNAKGTIVQCLTSLQQQNSDSAAELIVVDNSHDGTTQMIEKMACPVQLTKIAEPLLIPELWGRGAARASGRIIAFTTAHCIPDPNWLAEIRRGHHSAHAGVGGAIENAEHASLDQWAIYFCRYTPYMLPFTTGAVAQIPGDNGSYKRWVVEKYADLIQAGFWESIINDQLRRDGHTLLLTSTMRVCHRRSFGVWTFCRQRFTHGRLFGAERVAATSLIRRLLYIAFSPLIPLVVLAKIGRQVQAKRRHRRVFLLSLPFVILFVLSWALGECLGYVLGNTAKGGLRS